MGKVLGETRSVELMGEGNMTKLKPYTRPSTYYVLSHMVEEVSEVMGFNIYSDELISRWQHPNCGDIGRWHQATNQPNVTNANVHGLHEKYLKAIRDKTWSSKMPNESFLSWQYDKCIREWGTEIQQSDYRYHMLYVGLDFPETIKPWQFEIQKIWNQLYGGVANQHGYVSIVM